MKDYRLYSKESIKSVLEYVIDNAFFQVGCNIFRQVIGIPMGSDPATFIANLFLYIYENRFMTNLKKTNLPQAKNLRHVFRFIDDLIALNNNDEFMRSHKDIYPPVMELKVENENNYSASYLDLAIEPNGGITETKLFDTREIFKFSVVHTTYMHIVTYHKRCFMLLSALKFYVYVVRHQIMTLSRILLAN